MHAKTFCILAFSLHAAFGDPSDTKENITTCTYDLYEKGKSCEEGWTNVEAANTCVKKFEPAPMSEADTTCKGLGAEILTVKTRDKTQALMFMSSLLESTWLGIMEVNGTLMWKDGTTANYTNILGIFGINKGCFRLVVNVTWWPQYCNIPLAFYCEINLEPMSYPKMTVRQSWLLAGDHLHITCQGFVGHDGTLYITKSDPRAAQVVYDKHSKSVIPNEEREYVMDGRRCGRRSMITLSPVAHPTYSGNYVCCSHASDLPHSQCTSAQFIQVSYGPVPPTLEVGYTLPPSVVFEGEVIPAVCEVYSPGNGTILTWEFRSRSQVAHKTQLTYSRPFQERIKFLHGSAWLSAASNLNKIKGYGIYSVLEMNVTREFNGGHLSCSDGNETVSSKTFIVGVAVMRPTLTVHYHGKPPYVTIWTPLVIDCLARPGPDGRVTWYMKTSSRVLEWTHTKDGPVQHSNDKDVNITHTIVDSTEKPYMFLTLTTIVDAEMAGSRFGCRVYNYPGLDGETLESESMPLQYFYAPRPPHIEVIAENYPGANEDYSMKGTCWAHVGLQAVLTVGLVSSYCATMTYIDAYGVYLEDLHFGMCQHQGVEISNNHEWFDRDLGPSVMVVFEAKVLRPTKEAYLICLAGDMSNNVSTTMNLWALQDFYKESLALEPLHLASPHSGQDEDGEGVSRRDLAPLLVVVVSMLAALTIILWDYRRRLTDKSPKR